MRPAEGAITPTAPVWLRAWLSVSPALMDKHSLFPHLTSSSEVDLSDRWGKIRMLEPYEYNFKYHHPIPEVATHRPSCPLADGAVSVDTAQNRT